MENKGVLLTYHFRNVPTDKREPLVTRARELISMAGFNIGNAHCALEVTRPLLQYVTSTHMKSLSTIFSSSVVIKVSSAL